jgi:hypothetical protein
MLGIGDRVFWDLAHEKALQGRVADDQGTAQVPTVAGEVPETLLGRPEPNVRRQLELGVLQRQEPAEISRRPHVIEKVREIAVKAARDVCRRARFHVETLGRDRMKDRKLARVTRGLDFVDGHRPADTRDLAPQRVRRVSRATRDEKIVRTSPGET